MLAEASRSWAAGERIAKCPDASQPLAGSRRCVYSISSPNSTRAPVNHRIGYRIELVELSHARPQHGRRADKRADPVLDVRVGDLRNKHHDASDMTIKARLSTHRPT